MEPKVGIVTLSFGEYTELLEDSIRLKLLLAACYANSEISYKGTLQFEDDSINLALQIIDGAKHKERTSLLAVQEGKE